MTDEEYKKAQILTLDVALAVLETFLEVQGDGWKMQIDSH